MVFNPFRPHRPPWGRALVFAALLAFAAWTLVAEHGTGEPLIPKQQALTAFLQGWTAQLARSDPRFFPLSAASAVAVEPLAHPAHTYRLRLQPAPPSPPATPRAHLAPVYAIVRQDAHAPFAVAVLEYGVGTPVPFDAPSSASPVPWTKAAEKVYGGLESFWRAGETAVDPVTGETLPVPAHFTPPEVPGYRLSVLDAARRAKRPDGDALAAVAGRKPGAHPQATDFDPRRPLPWTGYAASLYAGTVTAFYSLDGFHRWDGGTVFVALRDPWAEGLVRFLPLPELNRRGGFFPGGTTRR